MGALPDGHVLDGGLVVSRKGGYYVAVYRCKCGREQTGRTTVTEQMPDFGQKGILPETVERFGWRRIDGKWECPFCTGNTEALNNFFNARGREP